MKKLLFYIDSMQMGGANRVMANLTAHFAQRGLDVVLVNDIQPSPLVPEYPVADGVRRVFLPGEDRGKLSKNLTRVRALREIIKGYKPDAAVAFMGPPNLRMLAASVGLPVKTVVSVRNDPEREYGTGLRRRLAGLLFRLADGVVFQTGDAASYFPKGVRNKSQVIFNPVSPRFYQRSWQPGGSQIVVMGRLEPQKNPMNMLAAFAAAADRLPGYTLDFYGDGALRPQLEDYVRANGLEGWVVFHGRTSEVERVLEQAAAYVLSSDYEGMPNALMEAMAVGVPAIATDCPCGGPRSLIETPEQGVLVPVGDSAALAEALVALLTDEDRKREMSAQAAARAREFLPERVLGEWESFLAR